MRSWTLGTGLLSAKLDCYWPHICNSDCCWPHIRTAVGRVLAREYEGDLSQATVPRSPIDRPLRGKESACVYKIITTIPLTTSGDPQTCTIPANIDLSHTVMRLENNVNCSFCRRKRQSINHFFLFFFKKNKNK